MLGGKESASVRTSKTKKTPQTIEKKIEKKIQKKINFKIQNSNLKIESRKKIEVQKSTTRNLVQRLCLENHNVRVLNQ